MRKKIITRAIRSFAKNQTFLEWWSAKTTNHEYMLSRSVPFFRNNLLFAVKANAGKRTVGAAGVIKCLDHFGSEIFYKKSLVVELCSNFVDSRYSGRGIARKFIIKRQNFCKEKGFTPVVVTREPKIIKLLKELGWVLIEDKDLIHKIRFCACKGNNKKFIGERCGTCPLLNKSLWMKSFN